MQFGFKACSTIIFIIASTLLYSQNSNDAVRVGFPGLGPDARALGMGNSFIAVSDNPAGSFFNPAGIGLMKKSAFSAGFDFTNYSNEVSFLGTETNSSTSKTQFNQASVTFPFPTKQGSFVVGFGYFQNKDLTGILTFDGFNNGSTSKIQSLLGTDVPFDLYLTDEFNNTPINGRLNQSGTVLNTGALNEWNFSAAIEVAKNIFIGGNFTFNSGIFESVNDYYEDDTRNIYQGETATGEPLTTDFKTFYFNNALRWDVSGWSGKLGLLHQWESYMRFAFTVQFPRIYAIEEDFDVNGFSEFGTGSVYELDSDKYSDLVKYEIQTPFEFTAGAAFNINFLIVSGQASLIDYTQMKFKNPEGIDESFFVEQNSKIKKDLRVASNFNVGAEFSLPVFPIKLRAGAIYQQSPYASDDAEFDRKYLTAGAGFNLGPSFGIDISYAYGWWKDFKDNYGSNDSRTFENISQQNIMLTSTFRF